MSVGFFYYEAPYGQPLDGLVDPVDLNAIRALARPSAKSIHPMAADMARSLGCTRSLFSQTTSTDSILAFTTAWALTRGVADTYIGEAQDLKSEAVIECLEFAHRTGTNLHLVFGHGQTSTHQALLDRLGAEYRDLVELPKQIRKPSPIRVVEDEPEARSLEVPDDEWMTFRAAYHETLEPDEVERCDRIYLATYEAVRNAKPTTTTDLAAVIGQTLNEFGRLDHSVKGPVARLRPPCSETAGSCASGGRT